MFLPSIWSRDRRGADYCKNTFQVPVSGKCPTCEGQELWGDLIKKKIGCYSHVQDLLSSLEEEDEEDE